MKGADADMNGFNAEPVAITVDEANEVSGLLMAPPGAKACYVLAHGAGAGMTHPLMTAIAEGLAERAIATLRYQFPYMEKGSRRPDSPKLAQATVRAAVGKALQLMPETTLIAGGKSFGGRMTSQAQAAAALPNVHGLAFLGFPLHPAGKPSQERGDHLFDVDIPMLFLQGTRDALAQTEQLEPLVKALGPRATLKLFPDADHSFHVRTRSGSSDSQIRSELLDVLSSWIDESIA
jgi:predicted alpha/beta-hydrolase family hydrolase